MAFKLEDRVKETTTTTGTSQVITLAGAESGFLTFAGAGFSDNDTTYYTLVSGNGSDWEVGIGHYVAANQFSRNAVIANSAGSGDRVSLTGTSSVFITHPADKTAHVDPSHYPSESGVAIWNDNNASLGYDSKFVWSSGNATLHVDGKTRIKSHYGDHLTTLIGDGANTTRATLDCDLANLHTVELTGDSTYVALSGVDAGQKVVVRLKQDSSGSRVMSWTITGQNINWVNDATPSLTTAVNKTDVFAFIGVSGSFPSHADKHTWYDGYTIGKNI